MLTKSTVTFNVLQSIQACRAIAALLVVCFHLAGNLAKEKYFGADAASLERICSFGGAAGVAFFFVLSGFIIFLVHRSDFGKPEKLGSYLRKRIVRIYPTYLIVFLGVYLLALAMPAFREGMPYDPIVLLKSLLLVPQDPAVVGGTGAPVVVVAWSLQYEVVFYALIGLAILSKRLFWLASTAFLVNFIWHLSAPQPTFPASFFARDLMLLFGLGMLAAYIVDGRWKMRKPLLVATIAITLFFGVGAAAVILGPESYLTAFHLGYGLTGALAIIALTQAERERPGCFKSKLSSVLGNASYAMYLIHFPLIAILCKLAMATPLRGPAAVALFFIAILACCLIVSVAFYQFIERPILKRLSGRSSKQTKSAPGAKYGSSQEIVRQNSLI